MIEFLRSRYPESLPRVRVATEQLRDEPTGDAGDAEVGEGREDERGSTAPGLASEKEAR